MNSCYKNNRLSLIEQATEIYKTIGDYLNSSQRPRKNFSNDAYKDGCMYQFFSFSQQIVFHFIFTQFITVIGNFGKGKLKAWAHVKFPPNESHPLLNDLKNIRARYADIRNNFICHINDKFELSNSHNVLTSQVASDINELRAIMNKIRQHNGIPLVFSGYKPKDGYQASGLNFLFESLWAEEHSEVE